MSSSMLATFVFGFALLLIPGLVWWSAPWLWAKLGLVLLLSALYGVMMVWRKDFGITILVVVRPFSA